MRTRPWALGALIVLAVAAFGNGASAYAQAIARGGADHQTADWLINETAGPLRRGLFGQLYWWLFPAGQTGLWWLFLVQAGLCAVPVAWVVARVWARGVRGSDVVLALGPAGVLFCGWDPGAFARKESLVYVALVLASASRRHAACSWLTLACWVLAVGSWEGAIVATPALCWLLRDKSARGCATVVSVAALAWSVLFPGTTTQRELVCASLRAKGLDNPTLCDGAIAYIGQTTADALAYTTHFAPNNLGFLPWVVLAGVPFAGKRWFARHRALVASTVAGSLALCIVGIDVGRWISLAVVTLTLCWLAEPPEDDTTWPVPAVFAYVCAWGLPHAPYFDTTWPALGALRNLSHLIFDLKGTP